MIYLNDKQYAAVQRLLGNIEGIAMAFEDNVNGSFVCDCVGRIDEILRDKRDDE